MSYEANKTEVLDFFDNHIMKYIIVDLEVLDEIKAKSLGGGGCSIPQASSTFSALDLIGYLIHPQDLGTVSMSFSGLLMNGAYFPEFSEYSTKAKFFDSFRDDLRSIMAHRFSLAKYDIAKTNDSHLFVEQSGRQIFNVSYFTKITIKAIKKIYEEIQNDQFVISPFSNEVTIEKVKSRITKLKEFEGSAYVLLNDLPITITTQTTCSLSPNRD